MSQSLWIAKTGLEGQQNRLSVISNNLANVNTTGFKRARAVFEDLLYQNLRQAGGQSSQETELPTGLSLGTGVRTVATQKLHTQGNLIQTNNTFDTAIQGKGFFQILKPNGDIAYTRNGEFQVNSTGQLVNSAGYRVQPDIIVPENSLSITIGSDGVVSVTQPGNPAPAQVGVIQIADFVNPAGLQSIGGNLYSETGASGAPVVGNPDTNNLGSLIQGSVESSNVNVVEELVNMIETQRAYEMNSKAISTADQMLQYVNNNL
ncbi:MAG: flagellar basal-body rod protein FlgG [Gammaproteobacteria bacterium]|nr:flagellar basal-body rod protein FlgG [Gammaproteobacteria bacterium]MCW8988387.1 flagellar basal-body rod protein FlgG [Gammaproteobacteria bacterium]MCW9030795.1 flagellar basal-body rod protein FlgG [Gammaproteobacteria bacterium]